MASFWNVTNVTVALNHWQKEILKQSQKLNPLLIKLYMIGKKIKFPSNKKKTGISLKKIIKNVS